MRRAAFLPGAPAPDPLPEYGMLRAPVRGARLEADGVARVLVDGATVHGAEGPVSVGRYLVRETLDHVHPLRARAVRDGDVWMVLHDLPTRRVPAAEHLLYGNPDNYYHWLLDGIGRAGADGAMPALVPDTGRLFQRGVPPLLDRPAIAVRRDEVVQVDRLVWHSSPTAAGGAFHPHLRGLARGFVARAGAREGPRDIFVGRATAPNRRLRNHAEIAAVCAARGFVPVELDGMTLPEQVALFAGARRIVGLHGAGLANLLFCRPGAAVLELLMDQYVNFAFRRLAACAGLRWGGVVGPTDPGGDPDWVHGMSWSLDPAVLDAALAEPGFAPG